MYPKNIIPENSFNFNAKLLLSKLKTINVLLIAILLLSVHSISSARFITLGEGESYTLNDNTYSSENLFVYGQLNSIFNITSGASIDYISVSQGSTVNMIGGSINSLFANSNPTINISGGSIEKAWIYGTSNVTISGGSIAGAIFSGGHATIYLEGDNFKVNGQSVSYGDKLSKFGTSITVTGTTESDTGPIATWTGKYINITGTLTDGSLINTDFYFAAAIINNKLTATESEVIIVPEPAAIALLSIGGLLLRRRNS